MQSYNKFFKFASVRVFFRKKIEFILLFYARRWLWMLAYGRHLGACFFLLAFSFSSCSRSFFRPFISRFVLLAFFLSSFYLAFFLFFLPARVLFFLLAFFLSSFYLAFFLLAFFLSSFYLAFLPARVLSFVLLSRVSSCSNSFFLTNPPPKFAYIKNLLYLCTQI